MPAARAAEAGYITLRAPPDGPNTKGAAAASLFSAGAPHGALRSLALPRVPLTTLEALAARACERVPSLRELDLETYRVKPSAKEVSRAARVAAAAGVCRVLCTSWFEAADSDGGYGSDGGSVGEYCGDGNVLKYLRLDGGGADDDEDYGDYGGW